jgi:hypothetical protein
MIERVALVERVESIEDQPDKGEYAKASPPRGNKPHADTLTLRKLRNLSCKRSVPKA